MTVRSVLVELVIPKLDGTYAPATLPGGKPGEVIATPDRRHPATTPAGLVLPSAQVARLDENGQVTLHLEHNDLTWLWRIEEHVNRGRTRFLNVEDGDPDEVLLYRELPDVFPGDPDPGASPAWWTQLAAELLTRAGADTALDGRLDTVETVLPTKASIVALDALAVLVALEPTERDAAIQAAIDALIGAAPGTLDTLAEVADALADDPNFAATMTTALAGKQAAASLGADTAALVVAAGVLRDAVDARVTAQVDPEATTRAAADIVLADAISDLADSIQLTVTEMVEDAVEAHTPGIELAFAERVTQFSHSQVAANASALVPGLVCTVVGTGRPVDVEFTVQSVRHGTAGTAITGYLQCNDSLLLPQCNSTLVDSPSTTVGRALIIRRRTVLADGVTYVFKAGYFGGAAGTTLGTAATYAPMQLSVTAR